LRFVCPHLWIRLCMSNTNIQIHKIDDRGSICDGPGIRTVVFLQGCDKHCAGCHNPQTWEQDVKYERTIDEVLHEIVSCTPTKRVTFSGGEPLLQYAPLLRIITQLKQSEFDIAVYTGFSINEVHTEMLTVIDYIKVGHYDKHTTSSLISYIGSRNQQFIKLR